EAVRAGARGLMAITSACCPNILIRLWNQARACTDNWSDDLMQLHRELVFLDAVLCATHPVAAKYVAMAQDCQIKLHSRWPVTLTSASAKALDVWLHRALHELRPGLPA